LFLNTAQFLFFTTVNDSYSQSKKQQNTWSLLEVLELQIFDTGRCVNSAAMWKLETCRKHLSHKCQYHNDKADELLDWFKLTTAFPAPRRAHEHGLSFAIS
jgi:hypothetical protein